MKSTIKVSPKTWHSSFAIAASLGACGLLAQTLEVNPKRVLMDQEASKGIAISPNAPATLELKELMNKRIAPLNGQKASHP